VFWVWFPLRPLRQFFAIFAVKAFDSQKTKDLNRKGRKENQTQNIIRLRVA
jgi:hypothetical protein